MNNLSSYCGLVDAKIRASDKDLPVWKSKFTIGFGIVGKIRVKSPLRTVDQYVSNFFPMKEKNSI